jgi:hypothetical protein
LILEAVEYHDRLLARAEGYLLAYVYEVHGARTARSSAVFIGFLLGCGGLGVYQYGSVFI